jgi:[ribosomal protein S5]-alanine N-acetyltransferase
MNYFEQESKRLQFRKLTTEDIPAWRDFFVNNDRLKFLGIDVSKSAEELAEAWISAQLIRYESQGLGLLAVEIKDSGVFVGSGGILPRELNGRKEYEISYSLIPAFWGLGYGTEIAKQMKKFGVETISTDRMISIIEIENRDSINVAKKNGMKILFRTKYLGMEVDVYGLKI